MIRALHRWPGLLVLVLITVSALSGAALSIFPTMERLAVSQADAGLTVVELASRIQIAFPGVEQIRRAPSGRITAYRFEGGVPGAAIIDPLHRPERRQTRYPCVRRYRFSRAGHFY